MIRQYIKPALIMGILTTVITIPILGIKIHQSAQGLTLTGQWLHSVYAGITIFFMQLFVVPLFSKILPSFIGSIEVPEFQISSQRNQKIILFILVIIGLLIPFVGSRSVIDVATLALIYVMLGLGLNVVVGYAGLLNLGYVGFYAIGAYAYALLQQHDFTLTLFGNVYYYQFGFWTSLPVAAIVSGTFGILLGFPVLRLRGDYLAIVTLGFGEIIRILFNNLDQYTNGPTGINGIAAPNFFNISFGRRAGEGLTSFHELFGLKYNPEYRMIFLYFIIFVLCIVTFWLINRFSRMPIGRAWEALREDEIACRSLGLNPTVVKLSAFAIGASFAGVAGVFFAAKQHFVNPESFTFIESAIILAIVVLGGMGSQLGVILAAVLLTVLPELAREFSNYRMLIFGAIMVLMMIWRPQGIIPASRRRMELPE